MCGDLGKGAENLKVLVWLGLIRFLILPGVKKEKWALIGKKGKDSNG